MRYLRIALIVVLISFGAGCAALYLRSAAVRLVPRSNAPVVIDLHGQGLTYIPDTVWQKTDADELNLSDNAIPGALSPNIGKMTNLTSLDLSNNQFSAIPDDIGDLRYLETLNLANNQISSIPDQIGQLRNLRVLVLTGNLLTPADMDAVAQLLPKAEVVR